MKLLSVLASVATFAAVALGSSHVVDLTPDNFDSVVGAGKPALVEFFAPWCGHCKNLAPIYEQLGEAFAAKSDKVVIAKVDADKHKSLGKRFGIQGFPTLKWFDGTTDSPTDVKVARTLEALSTFVKENSGAAPKLAKQAPSNIVLLTDANFDKVALDETKNVLVKFYAPWCGHCKHLAPILEKVGDDYVREEEVVIAKINCDAPNAKATCNRFHVTGYPTLKFFPKGTSTDADAVAYNGGRSEEAITSFLNEKCGTYRLPGGVLSPDAGLVAEIDEVVKGVSNGDLSKEQLEQLVKKVTQIAKDNKAAPFYLRVLARIGEKGAGYVSKELERIEGILKKGGLNPEKHDDFTIRKNILSVFNTAKAKVEDAAEKIHEEL